MITRCGGVLLPPNFVGGKRGCSGGVLRGSKYERW